MQTRSQEINVGISSSLLLNAKSCMHRFNIIIMGKKQIHIYKLNNSEICRRARRHLGCYQPEQEAFAEHLGLEVITPENYLAE